MANLDKEKEQPSIIPFHRLPDSVRQEFLFTLHLILETNEAQIEGFFRRPGAERFLVYSQREVKSCVDQLKARQQKLRETYQKPLARIFHEKVVKVLDIL